MNARFGPKRVGLVVSGFGVAYARELKIPGQSAVGGVLKN